MCVCFISLNPSISNAMVIHCKLSVIVLLITSSLHFTINNNIIYLQLKMLNIINTPTHIQIIQYYYYKCPLSSVLNSPLQLYAEVSFGSTHSSLSSSLPELSDSDSSMATRRANIDATSCSVGFDFSFSSLSVFSTFLNLIPARRNAKFNQ